MNTNEKFASFEDISGYLAEFTDRNAAVARLDVLGHSQEGRPVLAVEVTDPDVPPAHKQIAMVVCGRHGNELGARAVGPALLEWLVSARGAETRRKQLVVVVPVANPDGCVRKEFFAPNDGLSPVEQRTILAVAERYQPDAIIDVHSLGGNDLEAIITAHTIQHDVDQLVYHALAGEMVDASGRRGYPFDVEGVNLDGYNNFISGACYEGFHSIAFGMEVNHTALNPDEAGDSGAAAIAALLEAGNRQLPWQRQSGYPNDILIGNFSTSIRAAGNDAAGLRRSRAEIWTRRREFSALKRRMEGKTITVTASYDGRPLARGWDLCCRIRGSRKVDSAILNGASVRTYSMSDPCSTYVFVEIPPGKAGRQELVIEL